MRKLMRGWWLLGLGVMWGCGADGVVLPQWQCPVVSVAEEAKVVDEGRVRLAEAWGYCAGKESGEEVVGGVVFRLEVEEPGGEVEVWVVVVNGEGEVVLRGAGVVPIKREGVLEEAWSGIFIVQEEEQEPLPSWRVFVGLRLKEG